MTLKAFIDRLVTLTPDEFHQFRERMIEKKIPAKSLWLREGEPARYVAFIEKGLMRYFFNANGQEKTGQFFLTVHG